MPLIFVGSQPTARALYFVSGRGTILERGDGLPDVALLRLQETSVKLIIAPTMPGRPL